MMMPVTRHSHVSLSLAERRTALLTRIHAARQETAEAGRLVAEDLKKTERSILSGWKLLKMTVFAAGIIWSFNAVSHVGRGRRFLMIAISLLSTVRSVRRIGAFLIPLAKLTGRQGLAQ